MRSWLNFTLEERGKIREAYKPVMDDLKAGIRRDVYAIWPHDWYAYMSPIEWNVWQDIRSYGLPLYPQVPCGKYFIDFADPHRYDRVVEHNTTTKQPKVLECACGDRVTVTSIDKP